MEYRTDSPYPRSTAIALVLAAGASVLAWLMDGAYSLTSQAMVYLLAVVAAAFYFGRRESILSAILGVTALNFFFVPPRHTLEVENREYAITLGALLVVSLAISSLAARLRAETEQARRRELRARQLYELEGALAGASREGAMLQHGLRALHAAFGLPCSVLLPDAAGRLERVAHAPEQQPAHELDRDAARFSFDHAKIMGPPYWPNLSAWYVPLLGGDARLGVIAVDLSGKERSVSVEDHRHLETLVAQIAQALQRARLTEDARRAALEVQAESVRSALLASISHDLRTPLAVILGSASTLSEQRDRLSEDQQTVLLRTIVDEAAQMATTAENILQLARLSSGALSLRCDWESIEEIVGSVIGRFRRRGLDRRLRAQVPAGLPLVRVDAVLVAQTVTNLIDNALRYAPAESPVELKVRKTEDAIEIAVKDRGHGIGAGDADLLFGKFYRGRKETADGGVGLGLAICKAIVEAHGGRIWARNRAAGGAAFHFILPCATAAPAVAQETSAGEPER